MTSEPTPGQGTSAAEVAVQVEVSRFWQAPDASLLETRDRYYSAGDPPEDPDAPWPPDGAIELPGFPGWWLPLMVQPVPPGSETIAEDVYVAAVAYTQALNDRKLAMQQAEAKAAAELDYGQLMQMGMSAEMAERMLGARAELLDMVIVIPELPQLPDLPVPLPDLPDLPLELGGV